MKTAVVIPNFNGKADLPACLDSLLDAGAAEDDIIVVDNGSHDGSVELIETKYPKIHLIKNTRNTGFAAAVNQGINQALNNNYELVALFNNDALAAKDWLDKLTKAMQKDPAIGLVTGKMLSRDAQHIDSSGEFYSNWGLPYPRGRNESAVNYDRPSYIFGASGGASLYRVKMLKDIGLFDEDFFAYYEDVDLSFRAQLAGWKVYYEPEAIVYHSIGATSGKMSGFTTYQTFKNLPWLFWKNVPSVLIPKILLRFMLAYLLFYAKAVGRGQFWPASKGLIVSLAFLPKKLFQRYKIQSTRKVPSDYITSIITKGFPPRSSAHPRLVIDARESGTTTGRYVDKLIEYLAKSKPDFEVFVLAKTHRLEFMQQIAPGFKVVKSNYKEFTFAEQLGLAWQLYKLRPDLVHFSMPQQPLLYFGKSVTTFHDLTTIRFNNPAKNWFAYKIKQLVYRWVIRWAAHKSKALLAVSNFTKLDVANFAHIDPKKITVSHLAADKISDPSTPVKAVKPGNFIMYVGRPLPHKNLERLVEAFEKLQIDHPNLQLVLAGKQDALFSQIEGRLGQRGVRNVVFTGFVSEGQLRWLYENTSAYVFPSLSEGFGLPGLEAMVHGAPVISSDATCLPEIYGQAAVYFDPTSVEGMTDKINEVLDDKNLHKSLLAKGLVQAAKYSWDKTAQQTLTVYKKVI